MLEPTQYTIPEPLLQEAASSIPNIDFRLALNHPIGRFFNDPWEINPEFKGTVWEKILYLLDEQKGEARLIQLPMGTCYNSHADIDDRWHLSILGNHSYLIDLENEQLYQTNELGRWYYMNAGIRHSAANFGNCDRVQLVVRKLLPVPNITEPINISITLKEIVPERRFIFDDLISPWLNQAFKRGIVDNFDGQDLIATLTIEASCITELDNQIKSHFNIAIL